jgi:hypothetical protein
MVKNKMGNCPGNNPARNPISTGDSASLDRIYYTEPPEIFLAIEGADRDLQKEVPN